MSVTTTAEPYDLQRGGDWPGMRGTVVEATSSTPGVAFDRGFPSLWISDAGDVELDEHGGRYPAGDMLAWLEAAAAAIRQQITREALS